MNDMTDLYDDSRICMNDMTDLYDDSQICMMIAGYVCVSMTCMNVGSMGCTVYFVVFVGKSRHY